MDVVVDSGHWRGMHGGGIDEDGVHDASEYRIGTADDVEDISAIVGIGRDV